MQDHISHKHSGTCFNSFVYGVHSLFKQATHSYNTAQYKLYELTTDLYTWCKSSFLGPNNCLKQGKINSLIFVLVWNK